MTEYDQDITPYDRKDHKDLFDDYLSKIKKERSKMISKSDYKRILRAFKNNFVHETSQFKHLKIRKKIRKDQKIFDGIRNCE